MIVQEEKILTLSGIPSQYVAREYTTIEMDGAPFKVRTFYIHIEAGKMRRRNQHLWSSMVTWLTLSHFSISLCLSPKSIESRHIMGCCCLLMPLVPYAFSLFWFYMFTLVWYYSWWESTTMCRMANTFEYCIDQCYLAPCLRMPNGTNMTTLLRYFIMY